MTNTLATEAQHTGEDITRIGFISADSHVNEPRDLWSANLPASMRDQAMRGLASSGDGGWSLIMDGQHAFQKDMQAEEDRLAVLKPEKRLEVMRTDGVAGECIFPTIALQVWMLESPEGGRASCRIYNDYIYDQLHRHSPRFCCAGIVPTWTPEMAVAEVEHIAEIGLGAVMLPAIANPMWNHRQWSPMWDAIERTGLPVAMHQGTGHPMRAFRGPGATVANNLYIQSMAPQVATLLATSGVLADHPGIHVVLVEFNIGWMAWTNETMDNSDIAFRRYDEFVSYGGKKGQPSVYPDLEHPPSYYAKRQIHSTFAKDTVGIGNIALTGPSMLMFGNDYPHEEGTYPHSRDVVAEQARLIPDPAIARKVFRDNALEVFNFDPNEVTPLS
jgi:predicted TIM-barrel fold metal-dependent hydrolase